MRKWFYLFAFLLACNSNEEKMDRVAIAYQNHEMALRKKCTELGLSWGSEVAIVVYKYEMLAEIYLLSNSQHWTLFEQLNICAASGGPGRKLKEGDRQVPEGFYEVTVFNPRSKFHLSLGINYPNEADLVVANAEHPGGEIYIHGGCLSVGCCALTNQGVEPLYVLCDAARQAQKPQPKVLILPCRFSQTTMDWSSVEWAQWQSFWTGLQQGYHWFIFNQKWPKMRIDEYGNYLLETKTGI
jgi:murein L,D-transpeptidase YafK